MADDTDGGPYRYAKGSTFNDRATASGLGPAVPGIALRDRSTLGHYFDVVAPNKQRMILRQTDWGPAEGTGRGIDVNAPAARMAGYKSERDFPTDAHWGYRHLGESLPQGMTAGLQTGAQAVQVAQTAPAAPLDYTDLSKEAGFGYRFGRFPEGGVKGLVVHNTGGRGEVGGVINTFQQRGFPAQWVMDREGKIYRTLPEGARGAHVLDSSRFKGAPPGYGNANTEGIEVIGHDEYKDFTPAQMQSMDRFAAWHSKKYGYDPRKNIFGHPELNPGHKERTEGMQWVESFRTRYDAGQWGTPGPKLGSQAYWEQGRVKAGEAQVAAVHQGTPGTTTTPQAGRTAEQPASKGGYGAYAYQRPEPVPDARPRSEPRPQVAEAGPKTGSAEYWKGRMGAPGADVASNDAALHGGRPRHPGLVPPSGAAGDGSGDRAGYPRSEPPPGYGGEGASAPSVASVGYEGGGAVPERVTINITVAARRV